MATQFPITNGPSKWDLASGLFNWKPRHSVLFNANCPVGTLVGIEVNSIQAEDGSGESWNIEGWVRSVSRPKDLAGFFTPEVGQQVFIHFRTNNRQGHVRFFEKQTRHALSELDEIVRRNNERQFGDGRPVRR